MPGSSTHCSTWFVAVSITASRGSVWSAVKAQRSSTERAIRCAYVETGITASTFFVFRSMALTVPACTLEV